MKDEIVSEDLILLNLTGCVGSSLLGRLLGRFGSTGAILNVGTRDLMSVDGIGVVIAKAITNINKTGKADLEKEKAEKLGVKILPYTHPAYPKYLQEAFDYPIVLYVKGELEEADKLALAVVGTRKPSAYGARQAVKFSRELAELGICIVSGLARGIDTFAHTGALKAKGGRTVAVIGSGLDIIYPPENKELFNQVSKRGAVISEFGFGVQPDTRNFPRRNRIVSAMTLGTLVIEAGEKSGALITTGMALEQGKEVFCLPGDIDRPQSKGTNYMLKQGAKLVEGVEDILEEIPVFSEILKSLKKAPQVSPIEKMVLNSMDEPSQDLYKIIRKTNLPENTVAITLESLVSKELVKQGADGEFTRSLIDY